MKSLSTSVSPRFTRRVLAHFILVIMVILGLAANFFIGLKLGQDKLFYPIDPLRASMDIALSRLRYPPVSGYMAFGSIDRYLQDSGFSYDHSQTEIRKLLSDNVRVEGIWHKALSMKIDPEVVNVSLTSDLGYADFMSGSFALFGMHPGSLYLFYFLLLSVSVMLFLIGFWRSALALWLLGTYLAVHLLMVIYVSAEVPFIESIANPRAMTTFAVLPALHLVLQSAAKGGPRVAALLASCGQCVILSFILSCRFDSIVLVGGAVSALALSALLPFARSKIAARDRRARLLLLLLSLAILGGLQARQMWVMRNSGPPEGHHLIWMFLLSSLFNDDRALFDEYAGPAVDQQLSLDSDRRPCPAILHYYERKFGKPVADDCEQIPPRALTTSQYEQAGFELFIKILREHPWVPLVFLRNSPRQQVSIWFENHSLSLQYGYPAFLLALAVLVCFIASRGCATMDFEAMTLLGGIVLLSLASLIDPLVYPSLNQTGALTLLTLDLTLLIGLMIVWGLSAVYIVLRRSGR
jgi:hypothetical protein